MAYDRDIHELIGKRVLVHPPYSKPYEITILEISPSGKYVKAEEPTENEVKWNRVNDLMYCFVEVLSDGVAKV